MENVVVGIADCRVAGPDQLLSTHALGSCIGLALHDPVACIGGLLHFTLPDSQLDPVRAQEHPCAFADTGLAALLAAMRARGATLRQLVARAAGGANMLRGEPVFDVGRHNYRALHRVLSAYRIPLVAEDCGGRQFRNMSLEVASGRLWVQQGNSPMEWLGSVWKGGAPTCLPNAKSGC